MTKPIRLGMVGGGPGAMIGPTHRYAAQMDGHFQIVAGSFSRDTQRNRAMGEQLGLAPERVYPRYEEMAARESARGDGVEAVAVMTPNDSHVPISLCFLRAGVHVICDKPLSTSVADALALGEQVASGDEVFVLTHNNGGFPMVREARARVRGGELGQVRMVQVEYPAGARSRLVEAEGDAKTAWRTDPVTGGPSAVLVDLGVHAHHLLRFITGCEVESVSASLATVVAGRTSHDDAQVSLKLTGGARGALWASYVAAGNRNGLRIRVYGESGSIEWFQEQPDVLNLHDLDAPSRIIQRGEPWVGDDARAATRVKAGQPEGFLEAFANIYTDAARVIRAAPDRRNAHSALVAGAQDGIQGMRFVAACVASDRAQGAWTDVAGAMDPPEKRGREKRGRSR